jgi:leucyl-tRNA synthetase
VAPPEMALEWADEQIEGPHRFLQRLWKLVDRHAEALASDIRTPIPDQLPESARLLRRKVHQTIARVTDDIDQRIHLNTAVAALMELLNEVLKREADLADQRAVLREAIETLVLLLSPFTPHVCEEMWERLGRRFSVVDRNWPVANPDIAREDEVELAVQVNGKVRAKVTVAVGAPEEDVKARALEAAADQVAGKTIVKVVVVPGRLVNVVVK